MLGLTNGAEEQTFEKTELEDVQLALQLSSAFLVDQRQCKHANNQEDVRYIRCIVEMRLAPFIQIPGPTFSWVRLGVSPDDTPQGQNGCILGCCAEKSMLYLSVVTLSI